MKSRRVEDPSPKNRGEDKPTINMPLVFFLGVFTYTSRWRIQYHRRWRFRDEWSWPLGRTSRSSIKRWPSIKMTGPSSGRSSDVNLHRQPPRPHEQKRWPLWSLRWRDAIVRKVTSQVKELDTGRSKTKTMFYNSDLMSSSLVACKHVSCFCTLDLSECCIDSNQTFNIINFIANWSVGYTKVRVETYITIT